jgi:hypothetical protein
MGYQESADRLRRTQQRRQEQKEMQLRADNAAQEQRERRARGVRRQALQQQLGNAPLAAIDEDGQQVPLSPQEMMDIHHQACQKHQETSEAAKCTGSICIVDKDQAGKVSSAAVFPLSFLRYDTQTEIMEHISRQSQSYMRLPCSQQDVPALQMHRLATLHSLPPHLLVKNLANELLPAENACSRFDEGQLADAHFMWVVQAGLPVDDEAFVRAWTQAGAEVRLGLQWDDQDGSRQRTTVTFDMQQLTQTVQQDLRLNHSIRHSEGVRTIHSGKLAAPNAYQVPLMQAAGGQQPQHSTPVTALTIELLRGAQQALLPVALTVHMRPVF